MTSFPTTILTLFTSPLNYDRVTREGSWLVSREQVIWATWLLKYSSAEVTLCWALLWDTNICNFSPIQRCLSATSLPRLPYHQFSNCVPSKSLTIKPSHRPQPMKWYIITCSQPCLTPSKMSNQAHSLNSAHWEAFPLPLSFRIFQKEARELRQSTSEWCLHTVQLHL